MTNTYIIFILYFENIASEYLLLYKYLMSFKNKLEKILSSKNIFKYFKVQSFKFNKRLKKYLN